MSLRTLLRLIRVELSVRVEARYRLLELVECIELFKCEVK